MHRGALDSDEASVGSSETCAQGDEMPVFGDHVSRWVRTDLGGSRGWVLGSLTNDEAAAGIADRTNANLWGHLRIETALDHTHPAPVKCKYHRGQRRGRDTTNS